jgi:N-6 DNA Methylase
VAAAQTVTHDGFASADERRKRLGQFFTGLPPARLLAALALVQGARTVIDPMVGTGDMLMGTIEHGLPEVVGGIEIDPAPYAACAARLEDAGLSTDSLVLGSAFAPGSLRSLPVRAWDLVITNPPYVRYQSVSRAAGAGLTVHSGARIRRDLFAAVDEFDALDDEDKRLFRELVCGYSGLSDLAVPSWILCAGLVRVGGTLAMLVPTTWLSRDYARPIRYLIHRWFDVSCVIEDGDASWFDDALVRTTLVVAKRVPRRRSAFGAGPADGHLHIRLTADMRRRNSLVGAVFDGHDDPDLKLAQTICAWSADRHAPADDALNPRWVSAADDCRSLRYEAASDAWMRTLGEPETQRGSRSGVLPHSALVSELGVSVDEYVSLEDVGWRAGQGLRTGANRFFYVDGLGFGDGHERLVPDRRLGDQPLDAPIGLTLPVLRRQTELPPGFAVHHEQLIGRVLVLDEWALPEDLDGLPPQPYRPLPEPAASFVRSSAGINVGMNGRRQFIPQLSAVAPNARAFDPNRQDRPARFWYQLPPLTDRHRPSLLVARINNRHPRTLVNAERVAVIDANFSTLWPANPDAVSPWVILAILNSAWCVAEMELRGTVLGGGALKLEATHLRRLALPHLTGRELSEVEALGRRLSQAPTAEERDSALGEVDRLVFVALGASEPSQAALRVRSLGADCLRRRSS